MSLHRYLVSGELTIDSAIERLNSAGSQILLVVDESKRLMGTVTDGDVRRSIFYHRGSLADVRISDVMQTNPTVASKDWSPQRAQSVMRAKKIHHLPIIDSQLCVTGIFTHDSLVTQAHLPNLAFVMAGGLGQRLGPMTRDCPKPMLRIGGKPILETIVQTLRDAGVQEIVFAVNYLADKIQQHFGDGSSFGVHLSLIHISEPTRPY